MPAGMIQQLGGTRFPLIALWRRLSQSLVLGGERQISGRLWSKMIVV